jgi:DNA-binding NtrC family response regulator
MLTAFGGVNQAVQAMQHGASDYLVKPVNLDELELVIRRTIEQSHLQSQKEWLSGSHRARHGPVMIGDSAPMQRLRQMIAEVARTDVTVLIQGESGTGKELVAQAVHAQSQRHSEAFVPIDCCTLQENLFESELFGHERGAFTGADRRKPGLIEAAVRGTLFLDELGEAGPAVQAKLLRVIETGRFRRVGATNDLRADVRIVAATNRDLLARANEGHFRTDLYYRLSTFVIDVPPLRDRTEDIPALANSFLARRGQSQGIQLKILSPQAIEQLQSYRWPGNVRELRNVIERAFIMAADAHVIECQHLPTVKEPAHPQSASENQIAATGAEHANLVFPGEPTLEVIERTYLDHLLTKYRGNRRRVADALGVSERTAYRMLERHALRSVADTSPNSD